jgi:hypothetical protein
MNEEQARHILESNEEFLTEQGDIEDFGVALNDRGEIVIEIASPDPLPDDRRKAIRSRLGREVPVDFRASDRGKMAY